MTRAGIEVAIDGLGYDNPDLPKTKFIQALRQFYRAEADPPASRGIDAGTLIKMIWKIGDHHGLVKAKKKNLNHVRALINADLIGLYRENKNPEGLVIGPNNLFEVSDTARGTLLASFMDAAGPQAHIPLPELAGILSVLGRFVAGMDTVTPFSVGEALSTPPKGGNGRGRPDSGKGRISSRDAEDGRFMMDRAPGTEPLATFLAPAERHYYRFRPIPAGESIPGSHGFHMAVFPVTNALFTLFIEKTGYMTTAEKLGYGWVYSGRFKKIDDAVTGKTRAVWNSGYFRKKVSGACWYQPSGPGSTLHMKRHHPVVQVSLADAGAFAAWTGKKLPSEIEWETAARTLEQYSFPWGNSWQENRCNSESSSISDTTPVDAYPGSENGYGLADLLGNTMEWTMDECAPQDEKPGGKKYHIVKGGSWVSGSSIRLESRVKLETDFTSNTLGFRLAAECDRGDV